MEPYTAQLVHCRETIRILCRTQHNAANRGTVLVGYLCTAAAILIGGMLAFESSFGILVIFLGCWAMMAIGQTPNRRANKIDAGLNGKYAHIHYTFDETSFTADFGENVDTVPYGDVDRLIEDRTYCYFLLKSSALYMFAKSSVSNIEALKEFLAHHTGQDWRTSKGVLSLSLRDLTGGRFGERRKRESA